MLIPRCVLRWRQCAVLAALLLVTGTVNETAGAEDDPLHRVGFRSGRLAGGRDGASAPARPLLLWYPTSADDADYRYGHVRLGQRGKVALNAPPAEGRFPLLIFSHGFLVAADQSVFLTEGLARRGYIVAAVDHADSLRNKTRRLYNPGFERPHTWTDEMFQDRREDVCRLLDQLTEWSRDPGSEWFGRINLDAIGGVGHSLGGYTLFGLAGGWPSWKDERIQSVVLLSPYLHPFINRAEVAECRVPCCLQGGTLDPAITPFLDSIYRDLKCAKHFAVLKDANHVSWTDLAIPGESTTSAVQGGNPQLMLKLAADFLDHTLCGRDRAEQLLASDPRIDSLQTNIETAVNNAE